MGYADSVLDSGLLLPIEGVALVKLSGGLSRVEGSSLVISGAHQALVLVDVLVDGSDTRPDGEPWRIQLPSIPLPQSASRFLS